MSEQYFKKFPTITYNGYQAVNLMVRTALIEKFYNQSSSYYNIDLINSQRADSLSSDVYSDSYMSWILYLSNKIIDPYYGWNLSQYDFNNFLITKYGSVATAQKKIAYWNNNWYDNPEHISVSQYNAMLDYQKKYYEAVYAGKKILEYQRKQDDWVVNTNQIWEYTTDGNPNVILDEKITIYANSYPVANGQLLFANSSLVRIHQVGGITNSYSNSTANVTISGETKDNRVHIITANLIAKNISDEEYVYWSPVSYYDIEDIKNTYNGNIRVLNPEYATVAALQLKRLLNGSL